MRRSSALLMALLATSACASQGRPAGEVAAAPASRTIVRVEVTNTFNRPIDVLSAGEFLGTLAPYAHGSYPVRPTTRRPTLYARWYSAQGVQQQANISSGRQVQYVYAPQTTASR